MRLDVGSGSYAFRCLFDDYDPITGPTTVVAGHAVGTPAILPITSNDLLAPARQYHGYVAAGLVTLASQSAALAADVRAGNLGAAKTAWLTAHLTYERLGAAYDAFVPSTTRSTAGRTGWPAASTPPSGPASTGWNTACGTGRAQRG
jgi:iron uptake system component EfeO